MSKIRIQIMLCSGTGCHSTGSLVLRKALDEEIEKQGLAEEVVVIETGCNGFCAVGPVMLVQPEGIFYQKVKVDDVPELVTEHFLKGRPVEKLFYKDPADKKRIPIMNDIPFFTHQMFRVMRNKGIIDPEVIDEYIGRDGYFAVAKALKEMAPEDIIETVKDSGIRGRGGAGFPAGLKWLFASKSESDVKYVLCNADEGDPGAFMDRSILETDPHAVLEGMIIAARAINASQGYIYARTEYPLAISRLTIAINAARKYGLLGKNILDTGFDFDIEIYEGAGAFVCGEETALMRSIEGKRGMPRPRPPFPANKGLWEKPTILNNVETLASIPQIILNGADWYADVGTETSKGTKVFALTGDINNIGLVEVPMGTPLKTIIYDIGGGIPKKKKFKAVQLGGPSGGCVPAQYLDTPVDFEEIAKVGAIMGSGGAIVMDEDTCMVDMARFFMDFIQDESCGKCTPCREGTRRLLEILEKICEGRGEPEDIDTLEELSAMIKESSLCGLGQTAPNPVLSTLRYFRDEYMAHINEKKCPAKRCIPLLEFRVDENLCKKCGLCHKNCPADAIIWKKKTVAVIEKDKCIECMTCFDKCRFDAIF
ncbi:NADH-quinone oxidoreductase subunit NuoF [Desulfobacterales bacterium HSG16]|nr:NADH-quinone oxidoreductase subunit NuoF [Desulfobacterales bacterium HSG16]